MRSQHSSTRSCDRAYTPSLTALRLERMGSGYIEGNQLSALCTSADSVEAFKRVFAAAALAAVFAVCQCDPGVFCHLCSMRFVSGSSIGASSVFS